MYLVYHICSSDLYLLELEGDLRALLLKISVSDAILQPNPPGYAYMFTCSSFPAKLMMSGTLKPGYSQNNGNT